MFSGKEHVQAPGRQHFVSPEWPAAIYAIGDIHGCLDELQALEAMIFQDAGAIKGEKWIVYLGDYIDRGPNSAGVIDRVMSRPPQDFHRVCLAGNHETMALSFFRSPRPGADWLGFGGQETLYSYGISPMALLSANRNALEDLVRSHVPEDHIRFLEDLFLTMSVPGHLFVHAGIRPGIALQHQVEGDLLWIRDDFFNGPPDPQYRVIHGHTPGKEVVFAEGRICIDTGAYATGILTAIRILPDGSTHLLSTSR